MHANARNSPKLQALKNACTKSHKHERQEGGLSTPTRCSKMTIRTTRQRLKLGDTRAQAEKAQVRRMTLVPYS
jgi:hypothetical protein